MNLRNTDETDRRPAWIGYPGGWTGRARYFRRVFHLDEPVKQAELQVCGLGFHEARINGAKVGDQVLDPGQTDTGKRVLYSVFEVTGMLRQGENVLAAVVGHGWDGTPKLWARLRIMRDSGEQEDIVSGRNALGALQWLVRPGPILYDSVYEGEHYDARLEMAGWDSPGYQADRGAWRQVSELPPPAGRLEPQNCEPMRVVETFKPQTITEPEPGIFICDAGRNLAGWARIRVDAAVGTRIDLRFAENLDDDGRLHPGSNRGAEVRDTYVCKGGGAEEWEPRFTYHGFRYVEVTGLNEPPDIDIRVVRTDVKAIGRFASANPLLNRILEAIRRTEAANLHGIPTDCPQRDERMAWLNDMTPRAECALHLFNLASFYRKWMNDIADTQDAETGAIADTAPYRWGHRPGDPVNTCYLLIPWLLYMHYHDTDTMAAHFDGMRCWVEFLGSRAVNHIVQYSHYGDWAPPIGEGRQGSIGAGAVSARTPGELVSTANYAHCCRLLADMSETLGKDAAPWRRLEQEVTAAYNHEFWDEKAGGYGSNNQACNSLSLGLGLAPPERMERTVAALAADVEAHDFHLTTGNQCTKHLLEALSKHGHIDAAFRMATQETYPGWGYMLANGATTIWERWEFAKSGGMHSHNHPMHGAVGAWFFKHLLGISPLAPGFKRVRIKPRAPKDLAWASGGLDTINGRIEVAWHRREDGEIEVETSAPPGIEIERKTNSHVGWQDIS